MMLHQDGSRHQWVPEQWWDLIVTMDDATSDIYSAFFVEEKAISVNPFRRTTQTLGNTGNQWMRTPLLPPPKETLEFGVVSPQPPHCSPGSKPRPVKTTSKRNACNVRRINWTQTNSVCAMRRKRERLFDISIRYRMKKEMHLRATSAAISPTAQFRHLLPRNSKGMKHGSPIPLSSGPHLFFLEIAIHCFEMLFRYL